MPPGDQADSQPASEVQAVEERQRPRALCPGPVQPPGRWSAGWMVSLARFERGSHVMANPSAGNGQYPDASVRAEPPGEPGEPGAASQSVPSHTDETPKRGRPRRNSLPPLPAHGAGPAPVRSVIAELNERAVTKRTPAPSDEETAEACPLFWELATTDLRADGQRRYLPELTLVRASGCWLGVIKDVETSQQKTFQLERLSELAGAVETALADADVPWVPFKNRKNPKGYEHDVKKNA